MPSKMFNFFFVFIFALVIVGIIFKVVVYSKASPDCQAKGGILVEDALGMPTCVQNPAVIVTPGRR